MLNRRVWGVLAFWHARGQNSNWLQKFVQRRPRKHPWIRSLAESLFGWSKAATKMATTAHKSFASGVNGICSHIATISIESNDGVKGP